MNTTEPTRVAQNVACLLMIACLMFGSVNCFAADTKTDNEIVVRMGSFSKAVARAPYLVAKHKRLYEQALKPLNAKVTYEIFDTLPAINEAMASNKLDVVFEAEAPAIVGKAAGIDLKIVALPSLLSQQILVHKGSGINEVKDLRGKKIAVLAGTSSHYGLLKNLNRSGLTKSDVSIVDMTPADARSAFDANKVDAWAIWPPFVEQEEIAGIGVALPNVIAQIDTVMVVRHDFVLKHRSIVEKLVSVLERAKQWVQLHPAESQEIVATELGMPLPVIKLSWPRHNWQVQLNDSVSKDIQDKADFLKSVGFIRQSVAVGDSFIDTSFKTAIK
jgi:sulfonate transport system substrate-binding protein